MAITGLYELAAWMNGGEPDGATTYQNDIDAVFRQLKNCMRDRLHQEHFYAHVDDPSHVSEREGSHRHEAGRCHLLTHANLLANTVDDLAAVRAYTQGKIVSMRGNPMSGDTDYDAYSLWIKRTSDGHFMPLVKHLRGLTWVSGGLVHQHLPRANVFNLPGAPWGEQRSNPPAGPCYFQDADGVYPNQDLGEDWYVPWKTTVDDDGGSYRAFPLWSWSGTVYDRQGAGAHDGSLDESFIFSIGQDPLGAVGVDPRRRIILSAEGVSFESIDPALVNPTYDSIDVRAHNHDGTPGMGVTVGTGVETPVAILPAVGDMLANWHLVTGGLVLGTVAAINECYEIVFSAVLGWVATAPPHVLDRVRAVVSTSNLGVTPAPAAMDAVIAASEMRIETSVTGPVTRIYGSISVPGDTVTPGVTPVYVYVLSNQTHQMQAAGAALHVRTWGR